MRGISGARSPSLIPGLSALGTSGNQISPHNFWLQKPAEIELVRETAGAPSLLKNPHMDLLRFTPSELQHSGSKQLEWHSGIQDKTGVSGIKARTGGQLSPRQKGEQRPLSLC